MPSSNRDLALGEHGQLSLTVQQYEPHVQCSVPPVRAADVDRCAVVLADISVSTTPQVFGKLGTAGIDFPLPISYIDRKKDTSRDLAAAD